MLGLHPWNTSVDTFFSKLVNLKKIHSLAGLHMCLWSGTMLIMTFGQDKSEPLEGAVIYQHTISSAFLSSANMTDNRIRNQFILVHFVSSASYLFAVLLLVAVVFGMIMNWELVRMELGRGIYLRPEEQKVFGKSMGQSPV
jgi:hypothetical protein